MANYSLGSVQGSIDIDYDGKGVAEARADIRRAAKELEREKLVAKIEADTTVLQRKRDEAIKLLEALVAKTWTPEVQVEIDQARAQLAGFESQLARLDGQRIGITLDIAEELERANAGMQQTENHTRSLRKTLSDFGSDVRNTSDAVSGLGTILSTPAKPLLIMSAVEGIGLLGAAVAPAAGAVAVLPGIMTAVGVSVAAVKIGTQGMGDAFKAVAEGDAKKLAEAMAKLSPEAQKVVQAVQAQKGAWDQMKLSVQNALFNDLNDVIGQTAGNYIPMLNQGLTAAAGHLNVMMYNAMGAVNEAKTMNDVNEIFRLTNESLAAMPDFFASILQGFLGIAGVAAQFLPAWAEGLNGAALAFEAWVDAGVESGSLMTMMSNGLSVLGDLFFIVRDVVMSVIGVFRPLSQEGESFLGTLVRLAAQMRAWIESAQGQETIAAVWQLLGMVAGALIDVLGTLAPIIGGIATWFAGLPGPVQSVIAQFLAWGTVIGLVLIKMAPLIAFLVQIGPLLLKIGPALGALVNGFMAVMRVFRALSLLMMTNPWVLLIAAVIALVIIIVTNWDTIKQYLATAWAWIQQTATTVWNAIVAFFTGIWQSVVTTVMTVWTTITTFLSTIWNGIVTVATTIWNGIVAFFTTIWTAISTAAQTYWGILTTIWSTIWNAIVTVAQTVWNVIFEILRFAAAILLAIFFTIVNPIIELWQACWNAVIAIAQLVWTAIVAFLTMIWNGLVTAATTVWNILVTAWQTVWNAVSSVATTVWNAITSFLSSVWEGISSTASSVWNAISSAISSVMDTINGVITGVWNSIRGFLEPLWNALRAALEVAWNAISSATSSVMNTIKGVIEGVWNGISSFFSGVWNTISGIFSSAVGNVMSTLGNLWNSISNLAGSALNLLVNAGRNIVTGLWNGIQSMGAWLYNAIMGWVRSVVPGPVLQFLGIASPSRYMRDEVGKHIPTGIAEGIEATSGVAADAAAKLASDTGEAAKMAAAQEVLAAINAGTMIDEDFSFKGMSDNARAMNDALADMFYVNGQQFDVATSQADIKAFLTRYLDSASKASTTASQVGALPASTQSQLGSLAVSSSSTANGATPAEAASATAAAATASSGPTVINIGTLALSVEGNLDPTDPVRWRKAMEMIREGITNVEASYR